MDLSRFSIDAALSSAADASNAYRSVFYERLLASLFENDENLFVRTDIRKEREQIFVFPALYWLSMANRVAERGKALYLCHDEDAAAATCAAALRMAEGLEKITKPVLLGVDNAQSDEARDTSLLFASIQTLADLIPIGSFKPRDYGFVIADQADLLAELPGEFIRKIQGHLLPSWERKTLVIANKHTPRAKNFAWDFSDSPREIKLGETMGSAGTTAAISRKMEEADKIRFLLQLLLEGENHHLCVFCNLKSTAAELSARLVLNGVGADYIAGNLNPDRKNQIVTKALTWNGQSREAAVVEPEMDMLEADASEPAAPPAAMPPATQPPAMQPPAVKASRFPADSFILVLTDDGAKGLNRPEFSSVINYDIPLEPEFYFERLNFLKKQDSGTMLYNLVCERYMYGIPAIERAIDASLSLTTLDASAELPKDLSAGQRIEMPEPRFRDRDDRRGGDGHRDRDDRHGRDDRPEARRPVVGRQERPERPMPDRARSERPMPERPLQPRPLQQRPAAERSRPETRQPIVGRPVVGRQERPVVANPYAMSMEERLALYKKKYSRNLDRTPVADGGKRGQKPRDANRPPPPNRPNPRTPPNPRNRDADRTSRSPEQKPIVQAPPEQKAPESGEKTRGIFGRLQDLFGTHKE